MHAIRNVFCSMHYSLVLIYFNTLVLNEQFISKPVEVEEDESHWNKTKRKQSEVTWRMSQTASWKILEEEEKKWVNHIILNGTSGNLKGVRGSWL